ncbi:MAG: hypothetical protein FWF60_08595 [Oscillospiraceae bacterium]|nr:hypothetical protein [Oscillospiraceae bacterium]
MKKALSVLFAFLLLLSAASCGISGNDEDHVIATRPDVTRPPVTGGEPTEPSQPPREDGEAWAAGAAFGFASSDNRILIQPDYPRPEELTVAYGNCGETLAVEYVKTQESTDEDNGRELAYNFDNMAGHVYRVTSGKAIADEGYFLTTDDYFKSYDGTPMHKILKMSPGGKNGEYGKAYPEDLKRMELRRGRKVTGSGLIAHGEGARLEIFQFETVDGEGLYCLVFFKGDKIYIEDNYSEGGWRADDGGDAIGMILYDLVFVAESEHDFKIGVSSWAPESCAHELLIASYGKLESDPDYKYYRYTVPD